MCQLLAVFRLFSRCSLSSRATEQRLSERRARSGARLKPGVRPHSSNMPESIPPAVFTPDNEPYLGGTQVHNFDLSIPRALRVHAEIGPRTFAQSLTPIQKAAVEIIPQGVSIALSIRELVRQAYLYSAAILLRPLVERTGMIQYLAMHPEAVNSWHTGWSRKSQPEFKTLVALVMPDASTVEHELTKDMLHKLMHSDPKGALFNMFTTADGSFAHASGKLLGQPEKAEVVCVLACHCLRRLTATSVLVFGHEKYAV